MAKYEKKSARRAGKKYDPKYEAWKRFTRNRTAIIGLVILVMMMIFVIGADWIAPYDYSTYNALDAYKGPSAAHWFGTDNFGRDLLSRCIFGAEGTRFANHYTSCPLCVPARMSFMTGRMPTKIGVTNNNMTIAETAPTFLFPLVAAGYETVLVGRMHFIGKDLRHGFTKRLGGDMTPTCWAPQWNAIGKERGKEFVSTFSSGGCLNTIGAGESPVRYYDDMVLEKALEYLSIPHEKPQCIIVGTFGPHFPYVAEKALYEKYKERGYLPANFSDDPDFVRNNLWLEAHRKDVDEETAKNAAAAYFALIEESDRKIGRVFDAFRNYAEKAGHTLIYGYTSDHGDMVGTRKMYGKQTFFEESARVPLILAGNGIPKGKVITTNTSIMDIGPTLCELAGTRYEGRFVDGVSLVPLIKKDKSSNLRPVYSQ